MDKFKEDAINYQVKEEIIIPKKDCNDVSPEQNKYACDVIPENNNDEGGRDRNVKECQPEPESENESKSECESDNESLFLQIQESKYPVVLVEKLSSCTEKKYSRELNKQVIEEDNVESLASAENLKMDEMDEEEVDGRVDDLFQSVIEVSGNLFVCSHCTYKTRFKGHARRHSLTHLDKKLFRCPKCDFETNRKGKYKLHQRVHSLAQDDGEKRQFRHRTASNFKYSRRKRLKNRWLVLDSKNDILRRSSGLELGSNGVRSRLLYCNECDYKTNRKKKLKIHLSSHNNNNNNKTEHNSTKPRTQVYKCGKCDYRSNILSKYKIHILKQHGSLTKPKDKVYQNLDYFTAAVIKESGDDFTCTLCHYVTKNKHHAKRHSHTHSAIKVFKCNECDYGTNRKDKFILHMLNHSDVRSFECPQCNYKTNEYTKLKVHLQVHLKKVFKCNDCDYECNCQDKFEFHLRKHNKESFLETTLISDDRGEEIKKAISAQLVIPHDVMNDIEENGSIYTSSKLHECSECSFKTNLQKEFKIHTTKHHSKKLYKCSLCSFETPYKNGLKMHLLKHNHAVDKTFQCSVCSYKTNYKKRLNKHLFSAHSIRKPVNNTQKVLERTDNDLVACPAEGTDKYLALRGDNDMKISDGSTATVEDDDVRDLLMTHVSNQLAPKTDHSQATQRNQSYNCFKCTFAANNKPAFEEHLARSHDLQAKIKSFKCSACDFESCHKDLLAAHQATHSGTQLCHCPSGTRVHQCSPDNQCHMSDTSDKGNYIPTPSDRDNTSELKLSNHSLERCNGNFGKRKRSKKRPGSEMNDENSGRESCRKKRKRIKCDSFLGSVQSDQTTENIDKKVYKCFKCHFVTTDGCIFEKHLTARHNIKSQTKMFKCSECNYENSRRDRFNMHLLTHEENTVYQCPECPYASTKKMNYHKHLRLSKHSVKSENEIISSSDSTSRVDGPVGDGASEENTSEVTKESHSRTEEERDLSLLCKENDFEKEMFDFEYKKEGSDLDFSKGIDCLDIAKENEHILMNDFFIYKNIFDIEFKKENEVNECDELVNDKKELNDNDSDLIKEITSEYIRSNDQTINDYTDLSNGNVTESYIISVSNDTSEVSKGPDYSEEGNNICALNNENPDSEMSESNDDTKLDSLLSGFDIKKCIPNRRKSTQSFEMDDSSRDVMGGQGKEMEKHPPLLTEDRLEEEIEMEKQSSTENLYNCFKCEFATDTECNFENHLAIYHKIKWNSKSFKCPECDYETGRKDRFTTHMLNHSGIKVYQCPECSYGTNDKWNYNRHQLSSSHAACIQSDEGPNNRFTCPHCEYKTNHTGTFKRHLLSHSGVKPFKCSVCGFETNRKYLLKTHYATHSKAGGTTGDLEDVLAKELAAPDVKKEVVSIPDCEAIELEELAVPEIIEQFNAIKQEIEDTGYESSKNSDNSLEFSCHKCSYQTNHTGTFKRHLLTHNGLKRFKCSVCDFETNRKYLLKTHLSTHSKKGARASADMDDVQKLLLPVKEEYEDPEYESTTHEDVHDVQDNDVSCHSTSYSEDIKPHLPTQLDLQPRIASDCYEKYNYSFPFPLLPHCNESYDISHGTDGSLYKIANLNYMVPAAGGYMEQNAETIGTDAKYVPEHNELIHELSFNEF